MATRSTPSEAGSTSSHARSAAITRAPAPESAATVAAPIPDAAPVTTNVRSSIHVIVAPSVADPRHSIVRPKAVPRTTGLVMPGITNGDAAPESEVRRLVDIALEEARMADTLDGSGSPLRPSRLFSCAGQVAIVTGADVGDRARLGRGARRRRRPGPGRRTPRRLPDRRGARHAGAGPRRRRGRVRRDRRCGIRIARDRRTRSLGAPRRGGRQCRGRARRTQLVERRRARSDVRPARAFGVEARERRRTGHRRSRGAAPSSSCRASPACAATGSSRAMA